jgi:hypothetical protein
MKRDLPDIKSRREFIRDGLRTVVFGGIVTLSAVFIGRTYSKDHDSLTCKVNIPCRDCSRLGYCEDPKAVDLKRTQNSPDSRSSSFKKEIDNGE